jgi:hypothetical protein
MDPLSGFEPVTSSTRTVHLPYAGVIIQNNLNFSHPKDYGLMYYMGGGSYVHSHLSGLDMELYGAGNVMSGVGGAGAPGGRGGELFVCYYRSFAGHNTVVINGQSKGGTRGWKGDEYNIMNTVEAQAMEPLPYVPAASRDFRFAAQILKDKINDAVQQRTVCIVRTSDTSGYYLDMFRSTSNKENRFHDYLYHNIGDSLTLVTGDGHALPLRSDEKVDKTFQDRTYQDWSFYPSVPLAYPGKKARVRLFPGWHFFKQVDYSEPTSQPVAGRCDMTFDNKRYMHVMMPAGVERQYTAGTAPPILDAPGRYGKKDSRILAIRQQGEAWNRPFVVVFEPSLSEQPSVESVAYLQTGDAIVGAKVVSRTGDRVITDWIIAHENEDATYENRDAGITFTGRFAVARSIDSPAKRELLLYIGHGDTLAFKGQEVSAANSNRNGCTSFIINR